MSRALTRQEAYAILDTEREYQEQVSADPSRCAQEEREFSTGEFYCMMMAYVSQFPQVWSRLPDGDPKILELFRKIGGICVQAIEVHGAPPR